MSVEKPYNVPFSHRLHCSYSHPIAQRWQGESPLTPSNLVYPIFICDGEGQKQEISGLPNQYRWSVDRLGELLSPSVANGLQSVLLFGVVGDAALKTSDGRYATSPQSPVPRAIGYIGDKYPSLYIIVDVCLCAYTDHGHCGILREAKSDASSPSSSPSFEIDNDRSIHRLAEMATFLAECGAHCVAPSDMMDGRIGAIKSSLKSAHLDGRVSVLSYSAKFSSCMYGPFRNAAGSGAKFGDRSLYQLPPISRGLAIRATQRDVEEGADMIMVKPGGPYLDLVRDLAEQFPHHPLAIYHVSGEYSMLYYAAEHGVFTLEMAVNETINGFLRAGANIIITYYTPMLLEAMAKKEKERVEARQKSGK